ncbi:hypothetical protein [Tenacibaculum holothuriorum]|nr:hypothetical protein [Tenacibaculum holothuriorum]
MKKIKSLLLLITCIIITSSCSDNNGVDNLTDKELLSKKSWIFNKFEFLSSSFNPHNFTPENFEDRVNTVYKDLSITFNSDETGKIKSSNINKTFTWKLVDNKLTMTLPNPTEPTDDVVDYILSINDTEMQLKMIDSFTLFIQNKEVNAKGIQYYK